MQNEFRYRQRLQRSYYKYVKRFRENLLMKERIGNLVPKWKIKSKNQVEIMRLKTVTDKILTVCVSCSVVSDTLRPCRPPGSSVDFPGKSIEWVAIPFSRGSCQPRDQTWSPALQADSSPSEPPGKSCQFSYTIKTQLLLRRKLRYTDLPPPQASIWQSTV